ncbi:TonB-dependent receptor [Croceicoccus marinus]|uniref:TonB-dependent receptor n=1 Tax=Croceicoccus marinus TaxID=450378 RepID=UPI000A78971D|nr:TonB-dependent receptor [Croceicoccus marinus]
MTERHYAHSASRLALFVAALAAGAAANPAFAQDTTGQTGEEVAPAGTIIVTAQRRAENLQDVPVSLTAVTEEALESRQINDLSGIAAAAPSLQVGADNNFAVRGVGTLAFANTIDTSVALALDEVNLGRPDLGTPLLYDVARVEVLNGPQGLLFGKNASAGLLNIVTARPEIGAMSGSTDIEISNRATPGADRNAPGIIAKQVLNIPVSANSALRLNALYAYQESPVTRLVPFEGGTVPFVDVPNKNYDANRNIQLKAKYLYESDGGLSIYVIGDYNELRTGLNRFGNTYLQFGEGSAREQLVLDAGAVPGPDNFLNTADGGFFVDSDIGGAQATVSYEFGSGFEISNVFAWRYFDTQQNLDVDLVPTAEVNTNYSDTAYDQFSNELRLSLPSGERLSGQVGLYYFRSKLDTSNALFGNAGFPSFLLPSFPFCVGAEVAPGGPPNCSVSNDYFLGRSYFATQDTTSYAGFGQLNYELADGLEVFAGGRVTRDEVELEVDQGQIDAFINLGVLPGVYTGETSNTNFSWKIGGQYEPTRNIMLYGFYGRGYKGPGFNTTAIADANGVAQVQPIDPETSDAFEIGVKTTLLDGAVTFNVSAFRTKFDDFQVQAFDQELLTYVVQNAAKVTTQGVEVTLGARPFDGLSINGAATFLDAEFDSFPGAQCYLGQPDPSCAVDGTFDAGGNTLPLSPDLTATVQAIYEFPVSGDVVPFIEGNWYHRSSVQYQINQVPLANYGAVDTFGFSGGVNINDRVRASVFCKNCTNEHIPVSIATDSGENNDGVVTYNQRFGLDSVRSVGISLSAEY